MKKILYSLILGLSVLIYAGCSGDLHVNPNASKNGDEQKPYSLYFRADTENTYNIWAWNTEVSQLTDNSWPGDVLTLLGLSEDGKYIYKYSFYLEPSNVIISQDGGNTKFFDGIAFVNNGLYLQNSTATPTTVENDAEALKAFVEPEQTPPEAPDIEGVLVDELIEYSVTNCPDWYQNGNAVIWVLFTTPEAEQYLTLGSISGTTVTFKTSKEFDSLELLRCNPENTNEIWNRSGIITYSGDTVLTYSE